MPPQAILRRWKRTAGQEDSAPRPRPLSLAGRRECVFPPSHRGKGGLGISLLFLLVLGLGLGVTVLAQSGGLFDLGSFSVDTGGGSSHGGTFALAGTIGQSEASAPLAGGTFTLYGGFQHPIEPVHVFLPVVIK